MRTFMVTLARSGCPERREKLWGKARKRRHAVKAAKRLVSAVRGGAWICKEVVTVDLPDCMSFKQELCNLVTRTREIESQIKYLKKVSLRGR